MRRGWLQGLVHCLIGATLVLGLAARTGAESSAEDPRTALETVFRMGAEELAKLGLDQAAIAEMESRSKQYWIESQVIAEETRYADHRMNRLLKRFPADRKAIMAQAEKVTQLELLAAKKRLGTILDLRDHLSEEQFRQIQQVRQDRRRRLMEARSEQSSNSPEPDAAPESEAETSAE